MRKCTRKVARFHKINQTKHPHEFYYSQLQMFAPFRKEVDLEPTDYEKCTILYNQRSNYNNQLKVINVKSVLLKHLESVEQGTDNAQEMIDKFNAGNIDPMLAQDNDECENIGVVDDPDFVFKDPSDLDIQNPEVKRYKCIEL